MESATDCCPQKFLCRPDSLAPKGLIKKKLSIIVFTADNNFLVDKTSGMG